MSRLLAEAERAAQTPAGAKELWGNPRTSSAVMDTLKRPASGSAYTQVSQRVSPQSSMPDFGKLSSSMAVLPRIAI